MDCKKARHHLLEHLYGALEDAAAEAMEAHLAGCAACRRDLEAARGDRAVLAEASRMAGEELRFTPPAPRPWWRRSLHLPRAPRGMTFFRVAAAALVLGAVVLVGFRTAARRDALAENPRVIVAGPRSLLPGARAVYSVTVATVDGNPVPARVLGSVPGRPPVEVGTDAEGRAQLDFGESPVHPGEQATVRFDVRTGGGRPAIPASVSVVDGRPLLARVSTDRPLYRPGSTVRIRAVVLDRMRLVPAGAADYRYRLLDQRGNPQAEGAGVLEAGVGAGELAIPAGSPGGEYRIVLDDPLGRFSPVEREILVQDYRPPRIRGDLELDRDSYGPGSGGVLRARVGRIEGGPPIGASVEAVLTVGGEERSRTAWTLGGTGLLSVPFELPTARFEGPATLSLLVKDGGMVETLSKSVPITTDRLTVEIYPEGGELVAGLPSRCYFRAMYPSSRAADLEAALVDGEGRVAATLRVDALGMGSFDLTPARGAVYFLSLRRPGGTRIEGIVPSVLDRGVTLRALEEATPEGAAIPVEVASTESGEYSVAAWCRGALVAEARGRLEAGKPRRFDLLPSTPVAGVVRVTVLDGKGLPVAERLLAVAPARRVDLRIAASPAVTAPGDRVRVAVEARDENGRPVEAILGASVVDEGVFAASGRPAAASLPLHFLLGMEVDELERADVFEGGPGAARATDLVLGVQGWRRFGWRDPADFDFRHPGAGARVEPVSLASVSPIRLDNGGSARTMVDQAMEDFDDGWTSGGWVLFSLFVLAGIVLLLGDFLAREKRRFHVWIPIVAVSAILIMVGWTYVLDGGASSGSARDLRFDATSDGEFIPEEAKINIKNTLDWGGGGLLLDIPEPALSREDALRELESPPLPVLPGTGYASPFPFRQYAVSHRRAPGSGDIRTDFAEVLHWDPLLRTGPDGRASFSFDTSDSVTSFRIAVEAHEGGGRLGAARADLRNRVPFFLEPKTPLALSAGDRVDLPVVVANDTTETLSVAARVVAGGTLLRALDGDSREVAVEPGARRRVLVPFEAGAGRGDVPLSIEGRGPRGLLDRSARSIRVEPRGYPVEIARGGILEGKADVVVEMPGDFVPGSMTGSLRLYPTVTADLLDGLESLLEIPHGCFEQVTSTNYPNVLALDLMRETGTGSPEALRRAKDLLADGYRQLVAYECPQRGYEWWGKDPAHEVLTAYGLLEFTDMKRLVPVDDGMLARTRGWLLGRRDGEGGFSGGGGKYAEFSRTPADLRDAYILWALSEADPRLNLAPETARLEERARASDDPYVVALAARTLGNRGLPGAASLRTRLAGMQGQDGGFRGTTTSVTGSGGPNLDVETTALAALAFLRDPESFARADAAVRFLAGHRMGGGRFGTTQATVLALKALVEHARVARRTATAHDLEVLVDGVVVSRRHIDAEEAGVVVLGGEVVAAFHAGANRLALRTTGAERLPWALTLTGNARVPPSNAACAVEAAAGLPKGEVVEGEIAPLSVVIRNRTARVQPMTVARIGIPAGLEPRAEQLKGLLRDGTVDFWELRPREVTVYLRGLLPGESRRFILDLTAAVPGEFEAPPTCAYLYYADDLRAYAPPIRVIVKPASTDR